ncbi:lysis protein [Proteus mirabilis]|uniref:lysis protein n=1 Tax=Proteus mirabilis TaxID=584 RepID=UPI0018C5350B|nr:lysis protein [Proteus mirabilis]MBG2870997.1 lysis protein [Proteus mirabilis]MCD4609436.1 lysis protein [Proteus mirabilis]MCT9019346.1 lysis protein [Proteus mirabilis]HCS0999046.1 lysis protein [Proteus mirabilis]HEJ0210360.1 lysis protein [Proteus mirabilis]
MKRNVLLIIVAGVMGLLLIFKFDALLTENSQLKGDNLALKQSVISHQDAIEYYQEELARLSELDKQHTKALTDAKNDISRLNDELRNNTKRVYIKADCPNSDNRTTATAGMGNATPARLTETAQQDYLRLLEMMAENKAQTEYLIDYTNQLLQYINKLNHEKACKPT